jgi:hypothetical protein
VRRHNPWIGALWATGIVLVLAAVGGRIWLSSFYFPPLSVLPTGPILSFFMQLTDMMVLPGLLVGFATIAGLLFLHARNRARRGAERR